MMWASGDHHRERKPQGQRPIIHKRIIGNFARSKEFAWVSWMSSHREHNATWEWNNDYPNPRVPGMLAGFNRPKGSNRLAKVYQLPGVVSSRDVVGRSAVSVFNNHYIKSIEPDNRRCHHHLNSGSHVVNRNIALLSLAEKERELAAWTVL
jgi:hypothetical protein